MKVGRLLPVEYSQFTAWLKEQESAGIEGQEEDIKDIKEWLNLKPKKWFEGKSLESILEWMEDNLIPDLEEMKAANSFKKAANVASESELEDVYQWIENSLIGSEKQVNWAKSIAHNHHAAIVRAWQQGKKVPSEAKWWIENRQNIVVNLPL